MNNTAYLSNKGSCISFEYGGRKIRFIGPKSLEKINDVSLWDNGYIIVHAIYSHSETPMEDYIDLVPILQNLYINDKEFLKPIEKVEVKNV